MRTDEYLANWLDLYVLPYRAANTVACYRRAIRALPPAVMASELPSLDGMAIQRVLVDKAAIYPRAAQLIYSTLHAAMARAVQLGYVPRNIMDACIKPRHDAAIAEVLTAEQLRAYLAALPAAGECAPLLLIIAICALRRSEALGLQWGDLDMQHGVLHVRRQRLVVDGRYMAKPLKTRSSQRDLVLVPALAERLEVYRHAQRVRQFGGWVVDATPSRLQRAHNAVMRAADLSAHVTLHGMRHTAASLMAADGTPIKVLQSVLGHSKYTLTADLYAAHITDVQSAPYLTRYTSNVL